MSRSASAGSNEVVRSLWMKCHGAATGMVEVRGMVIGTGWAGEGYATALRRSGVDVVALCGRSPEPARAVGARLGIDDVRLDWRAALDELEPDVVAITTPAGPHREMVEHAARRGAHVVCEKPLGRSGPEARRMLDAVEGAGVRHAYGGTSRYTPGLVKARDLVIEDAIGELREIEVVVHMNLPPLLPYCWVHSLEAGGGMLMNGMPHGLVQAEYVSGGKAVWAIGHTDVVVDRVPVGPPVHDFRLWTPIDPDEAAHGPWRENDADMTATAVIGIELPGGRMITALFHLAAFTATRHVGYLAVHGTKGSIQLDDAPWFSRMSYRSAASDQWTEVPFTAEENPIQSGWDHLIKDFAADINGHRTGSYPTFTDGWRANELMDQVRASRPTAAHQPA
ncbi:Gfo/Idh/MocA family protein [Microlunatus sp. Gsoil 973]|uniref:Gfo/Idh/MocA family protein n=1 Tax=Microlunatus sp. Gsoil 973 TaxID=2672569 RepID=UPI0018A87455|nr:Gfo/Idh/MocA family oxidoreductase [Microlunatus sp. Gsoil 973]